MVDIDLSLPEGFLEEETRNGYVVSKKQKEIWAIELDLAMKIIDICNRNNLKIYTCGGTTLGAIRHQGFIPWDDDMDFMMFRDDYDKLEVIAKEELKYPYFYQVENNDLGTVRRHSQVRRSDTTAILNDELGKNYSFNQGIFIDIFPIDYVPAKTEDVEKYGKKAVNLLKNSKRIAGFSSRYSGKDKGLRKVYRYIANKLFGKIVVSLDIERKLYRRFEETCMKFNKTGNNGEVALLSFDYFYPEERMQESDFDSFEMLPFEFIKIPVAKGYDRELRIWYGDDYMTPRNVSSSHGGVFFDTDKSYTEYIESKK